MHHRIIKCMLFALINTLRHPCTDLDLLVMVNLLVGVANGAFVLCATTRWASPLSNPPPSAPSCITLGARDAAVCNLDTDHAVRTIHDAMLPLAHLERGR